MCFSATASIASAGVLLMMGIASLKKAMPQKNLYPFAALPIFFGIQQACEWMVWTGFNTSNQTYIYSNEILTSINKNQFAETKPLKNKRQFEW